MNKKQGFTLIELLLVIAVIGLLASVVLGQVRNAQKRAIDARRVSDMKTIQNALAFYYDDFGQYPDEVAENNCGGYDSSTVNGFIPPLSNPKYIAAGTPVDPANETGPTCLGTLHRYLYRRYAPGEACSGSPAMYHLRIRLFDTPVGASESEQRIAWGSPQNCPCGSGGSLNNNGAWNYCGTE